MAQDMLKNTLFALLLFVLFGAMTLYAVVGIGDNYGISSDEIGNGTLKYSSFESSIENVSTSSENYRERFATGESTGILSLLEDMPSLIIIPFDIIGETLENVLGVPQVVTNILLGMLSLTILFGIWRVWEAGD